MPSGRGPWTVSNDGGIPVGAIVVGVIFAWVAVVVAAWLSRNAAWIYAGIAATASAAAAVFAGVRRHERYLQTWRGESEALFGLMRRRKQVRAIGVPELTPQPAPTTKPAVELEVRPELTTNVVPAIEGRKVIPGVVEPVEVPVWTAR